MALLPYAAGMRAGYTFGSLLGKFNKRRMRIVETNLALCFPQFNTSQRHQIARKHLREVGASIYETAMFHFWSDSRIRQRMDVTGMDHLLGALHKGQGVILLGGHFVAMEIAILGLALALRQHGNSAKIHPVYQVNENPLLEHLISSIRNRRVGPGIDRNHIKQMIQTLRAGGIVWYAPDQAFHAKGAEQVEFFGQPAWSNTATSRLAAISQAQVVPFLMARTKKGRYQLSLLPPLAHFPGTSAREDTLRYHQLLEEQVKHYPEQYLWIHRRFKPPVNQPDPYQAPLSSLTR